MINDGTRPSRLELARRYTGETSGETPAALLATWDAERARMPVFDAGILRAAAHRLDEAPPARPRGASPAWAWSLLALVPVGIALALVLRAPGSENRVKGESDLDFYVMRDEAVWPGDPEATFREGDRLQFTYLSNADRMVLLSVDGDGRTSVFYPDTGVAPVAITPGERRVLDGSVILDDAPGPEVFVAFFGEAWDADRARDAATRAWADGGAEALEALDARSPDVATLTLRRP